MNVHELIEQSAARWPRRTALVDEQGELDYQTLAEGVADVRRQLLALGVEPGQGVGVMGRNGRAFILGVFGALGCGATVLPMSPRMRQAELDAFFAAARVHAALDDARGVRPVEGAEAPVAIRGTSPMRFTWTTADRSRPCVEIVPDAALVRFTSGTTDESKGVVVSHQGVLERTAAANRGLGLTCEDAVIWVLPMAFHFFVSIILYLRVGAAIVVCPDHLAETILDAANRRRGTLLYASPLHYRLLAADGSGARFESLRRAISTAIALPIAVARDFEARFALPLTQAYGIIEVGLPMINLDRPHDRPDSVGRPLPDYEAAILDERLGRLPPGSPGQLAVRGPGMFAAYLSPPRTREDVLRNGWFLTGDVATQDEDGFVTVVGRSKSMINVAGNKVFPEEVESVLNRHPRVAASRVSGRKHPHLGEVVHADVVLNDGEPVDAEELLSFCRRQVSSYKVPQSVAFVSSVTETASGKISRHGPAP